MASGSSSCRNIQKWFTAVDKRTPAPRRTVEPFTVTNERRLRAPDQGGLVQPARHQELAEGDPSNLSAQAAAPAARIPAPATRSDLRPRSPVHQDRRARAAVGRTARARRAVKVPRRALH